MMNLTTNDRQYYELVDTNSVSPVPSHSVNSFRWNQHPSLKTKLIKL